MPIVTARDTITSTRPAAKASLASAAARSIAVRAEAETNGDRTGSRRSAMMIRGPWARYAPTRISHRAVSRMLSTSGIACGVPSNGTAASHACASPAMPKAMANRFGGTRRPGNLCRFGPGSFSTIWGMDICPPEVAALSVSSGCMPEARLPPPGLRCPGSREVWARAGSPAQRAGPQPGEPARRLGPTPT
jgi:hypothetical protein